MEADSNTAPRQTTYYGLEDVGVMPIQLGITVITLANHEQSRAALFATWDLPSPLYYRLDKDDKEIVPVSTSGFLWGAPG